MILQRCSEVDWLGRAEFRLEARPGVQYQAAGALLPVLGCLVVLEDTEYLATAESDWLLTHGVFA